jgi:Leucine-rich repeat (LRR) protein
LFFIIRTIPNCRHDFDDYSTTQLLKIRLIDPKISNFTAISLNFKPFTHVFLGIGDNFPKLDTLTISKQNISVVQRQSFKRLEKLEYLNLEENQIEFLLEEIFWDLPNLKFLNISNNRISQLPAKIFINLRNIATIDFSNNRVKEVPSSLFQNNLKLKTIDVSFNGLRTNQINVSMIPNVVIINQFEGVFKALQSLKPLVTSFFGLLKREKSNK